MNSSNTQASFPPSSDYGDRGKEKSEKLLQEFRQHARHGVLHALDVIDDGRDQRAGGVLLKKCRRAPQDGVVEIVAQVGDHAEPGVVHQIGSGIIENALQHGGGHQREGNYGPCIVEMRGNKLLQIDDMVRCREW